MQAEDENGRDQDSAGEWRDRGGEDTDCRYGTVEPRSLLHAGEHSHPERQRDEDDKEPKTQDRGIFQPQHDDVRHWRQEQPRLSPLADDEMPEPRQVTQNDRLVITVGRKPKLPLLWRGVRSEFG